MLLADGGVPWCGGIACVKPPFLIRVFVFVFVCCICVCVFISLKPPFPRHTHLRLKKYDADGGEPWCGGIACVCSY